MDAVARREFRYEPPLRDNYCAAAPVVAPKANCNVANFSNVASGLLYGLADSRYKEEEETEILAQPEAGKRSIRRASAICDALAPPEPDEPPMMMPTRRSPRRIRDRRHPRRPAAGCAAARACRARDLREFQLADFDRSVTKLLPHITKLLAHAEAPTTAPMIWKGSQISLRPFAIAGPLDRPPPKPKPTRCLRCLPER